MSKQYNIRKRTIDTGAAKNLERPVKESVYESLESLSWKFGYDAIKPLGILERESIKEKSNEKVFTKKKQ